MTTQQLSGTTQNVLDALRDYTRTHGHPPTLRELCALTGIASTSTVAHHVQTLEARGRITRVPNSPRSLVITDDPPEDGPGHPSRELSPYELDTAALVVVCDREGVTRVWTDDDVPLAENAAALRAIADRIDPPTS